MSEEWPYPRQRHVWLWGDPLDGKSTLIKWSIMKGIIVARGLTPQYHDPQLYRSDCATVFFDDFKGNWSLEDLINLMEGNFMLNPKYDSQKDMKFKKL